MSWIEATCSAIWKSGNLVSQSNWLSSVGNAVGGTTTQRCFFCLSFGLRQLCSSGAHVDWVLHVYAALGTSIHILCCGMDYTHPRVYRHQRLLRRHSSDQRNFICIALFCLFGLGQTNGLGKRVSDVDAICVHPLVGPSMVASLGNVTIEGL